MGYDVDVFFLERPGVSIEEAATIVTDVTRITMSPSSNSMGEAYLGWILDLHVYLFMRRGFLRDDVRDGFQVPFSAFQFNLSFGRQAGARSEIIHPVAFDVARALSSSLGERALLCMNGIEFFGAIFESGSLVAERLSTKGVELVASPWRLVPEVALRFTDQDAGLRAIEFLTGRFPHRCNPQGEVWLAKEAVDALAREGIPFTVVHA